MMVSVKSRARNLDDRTIEKIVQILDGWSGKLSWDLFVVAIAKVTHITYTRQALNNHARIKDAFTGRKSELTGRSPKSLDSKPPELKLALQRIIRLQAENERLNRENNNLLNQFIRWAYNASTRNLSKEFLDQPLPGVNRDRTREPKLISSQNKSE